MPYQKTKDGSLVNEVTLGDGYPLSNDLQPLKVGGEASPIEMSTSLPDNSDNGKVKVRGDLEVTGGLNFKNDVEVDLSFDDLSLSGDLVVAGSVGIGTTSPNAALEVKTTGDTLCRLSTDGDAGDVAHLQLYRNSAAYAQFHYEADGGTNAGLHLTDFRDSENAHIIFNTRGDNERMRIESDGKVGIGLTAPTTTLDVEGTVSYKHTAFTTAGPTDNVDVSDTTVLEVDTSSNNVTIGGFTGGVQGQILYIVKTNTANFIQLEHNEGGGSQDIFLTSGSDDRVVGYGGYTLYCNGASWFSLSNPTGAADAG